MHRRVKCRSSLRAGEVKILVGAMDNQNVMHSYHNNMSYLVQTDSVSVYQLSPSMRLILSMIFKYAIDAGLSGYSSKKLTP